MIVVCEPGCWASEHVPVNAGILATIRAAYPSRTVSFFGEESHLNLIKELLGFEMAQSIRWNKVTLPPRYSAFKTRLASDLKLINHVLSRTIDGGHLLLTAGGPSTVLAIKALLGLVHRGKKAQIILHGGIASLMGWRSRNPLVRAQDFKTALRVGGNRNIQYIVLEEPIRDELVRGLPFLTRCVEVLDHPIPVNEGFEDSVQFKPPFQFGFLGLATEQKGFMKFVEIASEVGKRYPGRAEFHAIGRIHSDLKEKDMPAVQALSTKPSEAALSRSDFAAAVSALHFVCLFFQGNHYELSPSGVLLDSVAWEKPVIGTESSLLKNLRERFGDIGYLCGNGDLNVTVESIVRNGDPVRYRGQTRAVRKVKESRTPQALGRKYQELCERLYTL
jgi:hypothetical protein